ncbi:hypothetical protein HZS_5197 [Henneguya salminicola]|nr:hypothetical protein HZS_5197 [Henneguya salminicola]
MWEKTWKNQIPQRPICGWALGIRSSRKNSRASFFLFSFLKRRTESLKPVIQPLQGERIKNHHRLLPIYNKFAKFGRRDRRAFSTRLSMIISVAEKESFGFTGMLHKGPFVILCEIVLNLVFLIENGSTY